MIALIGSIARCGASERRSSIDRWPIMGVSAVPAWCVVLRRPVSVYMVVAVGIWPRGDVDADTGWIVALTIVVSDCSICEGR